MPLADPAPAFLDQNTQDTQARPDAAHRGSLNMPVGACRYRRCDQALSSLSAMRHRSGQSGAGQDNLADRRRVGMYCSFSARATSRLHHVFGVVITGRCPCNSGKLANHFGWPGHTVALSKHRFTGLPLSGAAHRNLPGDKKGGGGGGARGGPGLEMPGPCRTPYPTEPWKPPRWPGRCCRLSTGFRCPAGRRIRHSVRRGRTTFLVTGD